MFSYTTFLGSIGLETFFNIWANVKAFEEGMEEGNARSCADFDDWALVNEADDERAGLVVFQNWTPHITGAANATCAMHVKIAKRDWETS
jgi:hypothetical protein